MTGSKVLEGFAGKKRGDLFLGGCPFYIKNKLKSEVFSDKKSLNKQKFFLLCRNCEYFTKNLVILKDEMGLRMKNFNIMEVH